MKAILNSPSTQSSVIQVSFNEVSNLIKMLDGITHTNNALPPTMAKFVAKNSKKIKSLGEKLDKEEDELRRQYVELDSKGNLLYWDRKEKRTDAEGNEIPENEQAIHGIKCYRNERGEIIDCFTGQRLLIPQKIEQLVFWVNGEEKEKEYYGKCTEFYNRKNECHVIKIEQSYLEEQGINLPTKIQYSPKMKPENIDLESFYDYLVNDEQPSDNGTEQKN